MPAADDGQSLGESQMASSLSLPWGDRKTRLRLPPPQPAVAKSWHCQENRERKEEDGVWPSLRVSLEKPSPSAHLGQIWQSTVFTISFCTLMYVNLSMHQGYSLCFCSIQNIVTFAFSVCATLRFAFSVCTTLSHHHIHVCTEHQKFGSERPFSLSEAHPVFLTVHCNFHQKLYSFLSSGL